jgi:dihydroorotase
MTETFDLVLKGGTVVNHDGVGVRDVGIRQGRIASLGSIDIEGANEAIDCAGLHILPGVIDTQVHFREPGLEHKENLETGSRAAVIGGVTAVFEMPNTKPPTTSAESLADKVKRARHRMYCDFAFFVGATRENLEQIPEFERLDGSAGIKVFMGSSTGDLLVEHEPLLDRVIAKIGRRAAFHAEDEARLRERMGLRRPGDPSSHPVWRDEATALLATQRLVRLAEKYGKRVHLLHVSSAAELEFLKGHKAWVSVEVTPHHLTLVAPDCYQRLGTYGQMNPPVRDDSHRRALWAALAAGVVDIVGSDHAPHTREEKDRAYPASPSGMTGVQTLVPIMLDHVSAGRLSLERFVDLTSHGPQRLFGICNKGRIGVGYDADLTVVDLKRQETIDNSWIASRCGWSPYHGHTVQGWPVGTIVRGRCVAWQGEVVSAAHGEPIRFLDPT